MTRLEALAHGPPPAPDAPPREDPVIDYVTTLIAMLDAGEQAARALAKLAHAVKAYGGAYSRAAILAQEPRP